MRLRWLQCFLLPLWVLFLSSPLHAQIPLAPTDSPSVSSPPPTITPTPTPVPIAEVALQTEQVSAQLRDWKAALSTDAVTESIGKELPLFSHELDLRISLANQVLSGSISLDRLKELEAAWKKNKELLGSWNADLTRRAIETESRASTLRDLEASWLQTLGATKDSEAPPETIRRVQQVLTGVRKLSEDLGATSSAILKLQSKVLEQAARVDEMLRAVANAREKAVDRLLVRDSPALWSSEFWTLTGMTKSRSSDDSFVTQLEILSTYVERERETFVLHLILFVLLFAAALWVRHSIRRWSEGDAKLIDAMTVFETPLSTALILALVLGAWLYPQAPRMLRAAFGVTALLPTIFVIRKIIEPRLYPVLSMLAGFFLVDQLRLVILSELSISRLLFVGEMALATVFIAWLLRSNRLVGVDVEGHVRLWKGVRFCARLASVVLGLALLACVIGYSSFAMLLGNAVLKASYYAVALHGVVRIFDGLLTLALHGPPMSFLSGIKRHSLLLRQRANMGFHILSVVIWALAVLDALSIRGAVLGFFNTVIGTEFGVGSLSFTFGRLMACGLTVWAAFLVSRFSCWILEEEIFPRMAFPRGLPYAITRVLHYLVLLLGFFLAVAALGLDMTKFTVLAGAFGVGLGFGLQNIVNNFFSGLIVLFERPVRVGDVIQMGDIEGIVERIGIRATFIRTAKGSEAIVPNARFVSEQVINWTFSNRQRAIEIPISVAAASNLEQVIAILQRVAGEHALVAKDPAPQVLATKLGPDSVEFLLQVFTNRYAEWMRTRSDLALAANSALLAERIALR